MRNLGPSLLFLACLVLRSPSWGEELPGQGSLVLEKADSLLAAPGSSFGLHLKMSAGSAPLEYRMRVYILDSGVQRALFEAPSFDRDDSAIRKGSLAYFKNRGWPRYEAMSSRSSFLDSPLSWEDALFPGLSGSYGVATMTWDAAGGERLLRCELEPLLPGGYRRIELWLKPGSFRTLKRVYYTPSGSRWKTASYSYAEGSSDWKMTMVDELTNTAVSMEVSGRRPERMPDDFFDPKSAAKER